MPNSPSRSQEDLDNSRISQHASPHPKLSLDYDPTFRMRYLPRNPYGPTSIPYGRKHANLHPSTDLSLDHPMRNYLPDQL